MTSGYKMVARRRWCFDVRNRRNGRVRCEIAAASNGGPNDAYCLNDVASGSPWYGYGTFSL
jgi:hypothetical protein